jgi:hypothetical protein
MYFTSIMHGVSANTDSVDNPLTQMANLPYSHRSGSMEEDLSLTRVLLT